MAVVRQLVLTPGFYWIDTFPSKDKSRPSFAQWSRFMAALVKVRRTTSHLDEKPPREWVLFDQRLGFPETAPNGAETTEADTVLRPPPSSGPGLGTFLGLDFGTLALIGLALYVLGGSKGR
jgi:hypothetical protein